MKTLRLLLWGHESFAAAEGAIGIAEKANKVRKKPLRVILNGLGKTQRRSFPESTDLHMYRQNDYFTGELKEVSRTAYSDGLRTSMLWCK